MTAPNSPLMLNPNSISISSGRWVRACSLLMTLSVEVLMVSRDCSKLCFASSTTSSEREARTVPLVSGSSTSTTMTLPSANGNFTRRLIADLPAGFSQLYKQNHDESNLSASGGSTNTWGLGSSLTSHDRNKH